jgi:hypothetical protein
VVGTPLFFRTLSRLVACAVVGTLANCGAGSNTIRYVQDGRGCRWLDGQEKEEFARVASFAFSNVSNCAPHCLPKLELIVSSALVRISKREIAQAPIVVRVRATNHAQFPLWFLAERHSMYGVKLDVLDAGGSPVALPYCSSWAWPTCRDFVVLASGQAIDLERRVPVDLLRGVDVGGKIRIQARYLDSTNVVLEERHGEIPVGGAVKSNIIEIEVTE